VTSRSGIKPGVSQLTLDPNSIRPCFPALASGTIFLDNPGGTQVASSVIEAMRDYLVTANANSHGAFATSQRSDAVVEEARSAFADLLNAGSTKEIVFGPNMTTLTFQMSRVLGRTLAKGDEIIVTRLDHDANIAPWMALRERGIEVKWVDIHPDDCTLDMGDLERQLSNKTRVVAVGLASNAVGTVNPVRAVADLAHMAGAVIYVDAVHYAPHFPIDVQELNCDFLTCSVYKFYGPHLGVLYGKLELLERLEAYKVRPSPNEPPEKFEIGTPNLEGIAGGRAAVDYLASIGVRFGTPFATEFPEFGGRRLDLKTGMRALRDYEQALFVRLLNGLKAVNEIEIYGITDAARMAFRAPTAAFNLPDRNPREIASKLGAAGINVWDGNYYAPSLMERLGLEEHGGAVRVGLAHYNTVEEVDKFLKELDNLAA
jgi:cysteine desulfurase family protein (TIGR01976 family)